MSSWRHVHFVGIGGSGLSAIARVMLEQGSEVSGSDLRLSPVAQALAQAGACVFEGHHEEQIAGADVVVVSSAVPGSNVEVQAARAAGIPVFRRPQFLHMITAGRRLVAVAGTHGKTTTTSMISAILLDAGLDPTFVVGGVIAGLGTNARAGAGNLFVLEADEYERTFLSLLPEVAVILNVEHDHPDCYPSFEDVEQAFAEFAEQVSDDGLLVVCVDNPAARSIGERRQARGGKVAFYGLGSDATWRAEELRPNFAGGTDFLAVRGQEVLGLVRMRLPGRHNVSDAMAAIAVTQLLDVPFKDVRAALTAFQGVERRFEIKGTVDGVTVVDDYAHHPTEIRATLDTARYRFENRALWAVWQPHTYSRVKALKQDFLSALETADHVIVLPVYASRERDTLGIESADIVAQFSHGDVCHAVSLKAAVAMLRQRVRSGDVVIIMGAGDSDKIAEMLLKEVEEASGEPVGV